MSELSDASGADDLQSPGLPEPAAPELDDLRHPLAQELLFNPTAWAVWPAVALLRWLLRSRQGMDRGMIYPARIRRSPSRLPKFTTWS